VTAAAWLPKEAVAKASPASVPTMFDFMMISVTRPVAQHAGFW
jgi:hypothetical protein